MTRTGVSVAAGASAAGAAIRGHSAHAAVSSRIGSSPTKVPGRFARERGHVHAADQLRAGDGEEHPLRQLALIAAAHGEGGGRQRREVAGPPPAAA